MSLDGDAFEAYEAILAELPECEGGKMFGKYCMKTGGKAFACLLGDALAFKLEGEDHRSAMALEGAKLFDPSGKARPMKEWVELPLAHLSEWSAYAQAARGYVCRSSV